jgi:hypothetical protein
MSDAKRGEIVGLLVEVTFTTEAGPKASRGR